MKKLLLSLLTVGVVSAVAIGATRAYFSDTEQVLGNSITTGIVNISWDGSRSIWGGGMNFPVNLMPGQSTDWQDPHGLTHSQRMNIVIEAGSVQPDHLELQVVANNFVDGAVESGVVSTLDDYTKEVMVTKLNNYTDGFSWHGLMNQIDKSQDGDASNASLYDLIHTTIRPIMTGASLNVLEFTLTMPTTVGNELQGDSLNLDFTVAAAQVAGQNVL
jgi:predicted ribosomally synthesized peptide with SipW-like signal peptide